MPNGFAGGLPPLPSFAAALRVWLRIGLLSFGGPAGQIAMMHREVVAERGWVGERRFLHALSFCALLPGPEAQQLATYLGWVMHGPLGGIAAGTLFVLPGAIVLLALSVLYATLGQVPAVDGLFFGLKCAVLAIVVQAVLRMARRSLRTRAAMVVAMLAFLALAVFAAPFPLVVVTAAVTGAARPHWFRAAAAHGADDGSLGLIERHMAADPGRMAVQVRHARRAGAAALALWLAPVLALWLFAPGRFADLAVFYAKMAVVTVGGAYAVLAYVAQDAVHLFHWVSPPEMLAGMGLAETTPGPLILVLQFVAFMAGYRAPGALSGIAGGVAASLLALWVMFMPCFAFVLLGAPAVERLADNRRLASALAAVTACVVGVIANLAVWFGLHVLFAATTMLHGVELPLPQSVRWLAAALAGLAALLLWVGRFSVLRTLAVCAAIGMVLSIRGRFGVL